MHVFLSDVNNARDKSHRRKGNRDNEPLDTDAAEAQEQSAKNHHVTTADELREYRRQRSLENAEKRATALKSIEEENRRRSYMQQLGNEDVDDRLRIYIRKPPSKETVEIPNKILSQDLIVAQSNDPSTTSSLPKTNSDTKANIDNLESSHRVPSNSTTGKEGVIKTVDDRFNQHNNISRCHNEKYSRKEIDADNVETPPVTRRVIATPNKTFVTINGLDKTNSNQHGKQQSNKESSEQDIPGFFDRYSATRRTRRYKRPTDYSSGNEEFLSTKDTSESSNVRQSSSVGDMEMLHGKVQETSNQNKTTLGKLIPEQPTQITPKPVAERTITKLEKVGRHISSINQEDVQEAIRNLKSPTNTPDRIWSPPRDIIGSHIANASLQSPKPITQNAAVIKLSSHELNDEGFEETQSLVSDTPSQGKESTNSSCNGASELVTPHTRVTATKTTTPRSNTSKPNTSRLADRLQTSKLRNVLPQKSQPPYHQQTAPSIRPPNSTQMDRSRSFRTPNGPAVVQPVFGAGSNAARRSHSMRRPGSSQQETAQSVHTSPLHAVRRDVERSSSRNSLRSSRSSINSAASTSTVRRMPIVVSKTPLQTVSVDSSPSKRPLTMQNNVPPHMRVVSGASANRQPVIPASRSSSSGSSIGQHVVVVRKVTGNGGIGGAISSGQRTVHLGSASFKENQTNSPPTRTNIARSAVLVKATISQQAAPQTTHTRTGSSTRSGSGNRGMSSFMRPTASSVTKRTK